MHLSSVPPPVARSPFWLGFQAMALTAALCSLNFASAFWLCMFQIISLLSLPPLANYCPSKDHLSPQTSYLWPVWVWVILFLALMSLLMMVLSLDPVEIVEPFQETALTLPRWPPTVLTNLQWVVSQIWVSPELVPIARCCPLLLHPTLVIESSRGTSQSFLTWDVHALQT
jgi:hypothetical protein